ncbi:MAG TPA: type I DNA topoisomerase [Thermoanaerobaculia bacterium]|nr:type I DNA topoisomerase [Thermoanaerobaculia bacterium]
MAKNLIIVESPAKTRTLKKFLGRDWAVEASVGHIRDLPKKDMGLGPGFEPQYAVLASKKDVVKRLREAAKKAERIYLAPDPDREGEAIAWHISEVLGKEAREVHRVTFNEITKKAVLLALEHPGTIDAHLVDAQQARRVLDRLMGFKLSPLLWDKVKRGLSAGRVQSVALKMVCERQAEIDRFVPVEYWVVGARLAATTPPEFVAKLHQIDGKKAELGDARAAEEVERELGAGEFRVVAIERKESKQKPSPPFITSRLQQEAARRFGFSVKRTMALAQGLYEGRTIGDRGQLGLVTYMRTDSTRVAGEAIDQVRELVARRHGAETLPEKPNVYGSKKGAQDAHEAIRPTYFDLPPEAVAEYLKPDELKLYRLIWDRFVASQMLPAVFDVTQVDVERGRCRLRAAGRVLRSAGFLAVYPDVLEKLEGEGDEESGAALPALAEGDVLRLIALEKEQKFTQPPAAYSEATLVKALEENGIGRPSTYAAILSTLTEREYADKIEGRFRPTVLGKVVNRLLQSGFEDIINEGYTARLEEELDEIEDGKLPWKRAVQEFDEKFEKDLKSGGKTWPDIKGLGIALGELFPARAEERCPKCGRALVVRFGRYGAFVGCTGYREEPACDYTSDIEPKTTGAGAEGGEPAEIPPCEKCGRPMALRRSRFGTFYGCTGYPECKNIRKIGPAAAPPKETGVGCPECGQGTIQEKKSRRGKIFYSCSRYPDCKFALWNKPIAEPCPRCGNPLLTEKTTKKKGTIWLCPKEGCGYEIEAPETVEA